MGKWDMVRIGDLADLITKGTTPTTLGFSFQATGINFIKIESISGNGTFDLTKFEHISEECNRKLKRSILQENDILFSIAGALGRVAIVSNSILPANINQALAIIRMKDKGINLRYFLSILRSNIVFDQFQIQKQGVAQLNLSLKNISDLLIPLPSLPIQQKIADALDKASALIEKRKVQIEKLDLLIKSQFIEMFGDPVTNLLELSTLTLAELALVKAGKNEISENIHEFSDEYSYPCFGGNGIRGYVKEYTHEGDYPLIGRQGALCGNVQFASGRFFPTEHALVVSPIVKYEPKWMYFVLKYLNLNRFQTGAAQPGLNVDTINKVVIPTPPLEKQKIFVDFFLSVEKQRKTLEDSLKGLELSYKSLVQKCFSGEMF